MIDAPKTRKQAEAYRYNHWAGNPKGNAYKPQRCAMEVWEARGMLSYQCLRAPGHGPDKLYCKQHARKVSA